MYFWANHPFVKTTQALVEKSGEKQENVKVCVNYDE